MQWMLFVSTAACLLGLVFALCSASSANPTIIRLSALIGVVSACFTAYLSMKIFMAG